MAYIVKKDYANAFNEAEPNAFLNTACRRMPGSARFAEWCYGDGVNLIYNGDVFKKSIRGQQGCPLMGPLFCSMKKEMRDRIPEVSELDFTADFSDDGVDGGECDAVFRVLEKEIALGPEYGLRNNYDKMVVYPLAGNRFTGDLSRFIALGIPIDYSCNVSFMQVPVVGSAEFVSEWVARKLGIVKKIMEGARGLSKRQVALYLLRKAGHGCRVVYYLRTTPRDLIEEFVQGFDAELKDTFQVVMGLNITDEQWEQASYSVKNSGLGLTRAADIADAAYLVSRYDAWDDCVALDRRHVWDDGPARQNTAGIVVGEWLFEGVSRLNAVLPVNAHFALGSKPLSVGKQKDLMGLLNKGRRDAMVERAGVWDKARLEGTSAPHAGAWLDATPNMALDTQLSNAQVQYGVGRRLGVQLCEEGPCKFCLGVMDRWGAQGQSCMVGGDKTVVWWGNSRRQG